MQTADKMTIGLIAIGLLIGVTLSIITGVPLFNECHVTTEC